MRVSELLTAIASWLESDQNEAILLSEYDENCLELTVNACVQAAEILKKTAEDIEKIEPQVESKLTEESLQHLNEVVSAFDSSGDENLIKAAGTIDELLYVFATPPEWLKNFKEAQKKEVDTIKKLYQDTKEQLHKVNKVKESEKLIDKSSVFKDIDRPGPGLSTRYCPEHFSSLVNRVDDHVVQCTLDGKTYDYNAGFTTSNGDVYPPARVSSETLFQPSETTQIFDSRNERLNSK